MANGIDNPTTDEASAWLAPKNILELVKTIVVAFTAGYTVFLFVQYGKTEKELGVALLRYQERQSELDLQMSRLELEQREIEAAQLMRGQLLPEQELEVRDLGPVGEGGSHLFSVTYSYSISNLGSVRHLVTYAVIHAYHAPLPDLRRGSAIRIGAVNEVSDVEWTYLTSRGCYLDNSDWQDGRTFPTPTGERLPFQRGGGGTAELDPQEVARGSLDLLIDARPNELLAFQLHLGFDGGADAEDRWTMEIREHLKGESMNSTTEIPRRSQ